MPYWPWPHADSSCWHAGRSQHAQADETSGARHLNGCSRQVASRSRLLKGRRDSVVAHGRDPGRRGRSPSASSLVGMEGRGRRRAPKLAGTMAGPPATSTATASPRSANASPAVDARRAPRMCRWIAMTLWFIAGGIILAAFVVVGLVAVNRARAPARRQEPEHPDRPGRARGRAEPGPGRRATAPPPFADAAAAAPVLELEPGRWSSPSAGSSGRRRRRAGSPGCGAGWPARTTRSAAAC